MIRHLACVVLVGVVLLGACGQPGPTRELTTVPAIEYGSSVDDAVTVLEGAGLVGKAPDVDFPHYVTGTDPAAGTEVLVGSMVELEIGDG